MTLRVFPQPLITTNTTIYTVPAGTEASVHGLVITNITSSNAKFDLYLYKATDANTYVIANDFEVAANKAYTWSKPINLRTGDYIGGSANIDSRLVATASVYESNTTTAGFTVLGAWNSGTNYVTNDVVSYSGISYIAIQDSTNKQPDTQTAYWQVFGVKGAQGAQGVQGTAGAQGAQGIQGAQGVQGAQGSGFQGVQGATGSQGVQGAQGFQGATGAGSQGVQGAQGNTSPKSITILNPTNTDNVTIFYTPTALTISNATSVLYNGTSTPNVTFSVTSGTSRATVTTTHLNGVFANSATNPVHHTATGQIPANSFVWVTITAVSGTVPEFHLSLGF